MVLGSMMVTCVETTARILEKVAATSYIDILKGKFPTSSNNIKILK